MRIFKNKPFARFARKAGLDDDALREAVDAAERGLVGADLGGGVLKQRVARQGGGKSDGFRTIVLFPSVRVPSSSTASPRAIWTISVTTIWRPSGCWRRSCWLTTKRSSPRRSRPAH